MNPDFPSPGRPRPVTVIGWTFLVLSLLRVLVDLVGWLAWRIAALPSSLRALPPPWSGDASGPLRGLAFVYRHFGQVLLVQATLAALVAYASFSLLRLRPWARRAIEVVCAAGLLLLLSAAAYLVGMWPLVKTAASGPPSGLGHATLGIAAAIAVTLLVASLLGLAWWFLRRPEVRRAFEHPAA